MTDVKTDVKTGVFPEPQWEMDTPENHNLDADVLADVARELADVSDRHGFLVVKDGVIVHETYYRGDAQSLHKIFSLTKGFGAALTGIAVANNWLTVTDKVTDWLPYHVPDIVPGATIEHILSMTAGHEPAGTTYEYTSGPILNTLPNILWLASGLPPRDFYQEFLAAPLGLSFAWPTTEKGWFQIGNRGPMPVNEASHRDVARLGLLWLRRGRWRDRQLISDDYIAASLRPPFPAANNAYGYLWWLNGADGTWRDARGDSGKGSWLPEAPADLYRGIGARGKLLYLLPEQDMLIVSMGETQSGSVHDAWARIKRIIPA